MIFYLFKCPNCGREEDVERKDYYRNHSCTACGSRMKRAYTFSTSYCPTKTWKMVDRGELPLESYSGKKPEKT